MSIYSSGRPKKVYVSNGVSELPHAAGEYRHRDSAGNITYIGETNDINRRTQQHLRSGKLQSDYSVEYKLADGRSTSRTRREHEQEKIKQHNPLLNKSVGGEGRIAQRRTSKKRNRIH